MWRTPDNMGDYISYDGGYSWIPVADLYRAASIRQQAARELAAKQYAHGQKLVAQEAAKHFIYLMERDVLNAKG